MRTYLDAVQRKGPMQGDYAFRTFQHRTTGTVLALDNSRCDSTVGTCAVVQKIAQTVMS